MRPEEDARIGGAAAGAGGQAAGPSNIFICYRRDDTETSAGRLYDHLNNHFRESRIFMDIDGIKPGDVFEKVIKRNVSSCDVFIVVIGKYWLTVTGDDGGRRLDDPNDFVRLEIEIALGRDTILIIPVLVEGAPMPKAKDLPPALKPLLGRNACRLTNTRWRDDVKPLIEAIEEWRAGQREQPRPDQEEGGQTVSTAGGGKPPAAPAAVAAAESATTSVAAPASPLRPAGAGVEAGEPHPGGASALTAHRRHESTAGSRTLRYALWAGFAIVVAAAAVVVLILLTRGGERVTNQNAVANANAAANQNVGGNVNAGANINADAGRQVGGGSSSVNAPVSVNSAAGTPSPSPEKPVAVAGGQSGRDKPPRDTGRIQGTRNDSGQGGVRQQVRNTVDQDDGDNQSGAPTPGATPRPKASPTPDARRRVRDTVNAQDPP